MNRARIRPLAAAAVALATGIFAGVSPWRVPVLALCGCLLPILLILFLKKGRCTGAILLLGVLLCGLACSALRLERVRAVRTGEAVLTGRVYSVQCKEDGATVLLTGAQLSDGTRLPAKVQAELPIAPSCDDTVTLFGTLRLLETPVNPGESNRLLAGLGVGTGYCFYAEQVVYTGHRTTLNGILTAVRGKLESTIRSAVRGEDEAALMCSMALGDRAGVPDDVSDLFSLTGTSHLLAVSGLHLGLLMGVLLRVLRLLRVRREAAYPALIALLWLYACLTALSPSVLRAAVMMTLFLTCRRFGFRGDMLNIWGLAGLVLLAWNPFRLFRLSFQLSFCACLGLLLFPAKNRPESRVKAYFSGALRATLGCMLMTLPLTAHRFAFVPLTALPANLLAVPVATAALSATFLLLPLAVLLPGAGFLLHIPEALVSAVLWVLKQAQNVPLLKISFLPAAAVVLALLALVVCAYFSPLKQRGKCILAALLCLSVLACGIRLPQKSLRAVILSDSRAAVVTMPGGGTFLVDCGCSASVVRQKVIPYLRERVPHLNGVLLTEQSHAQALTDALWEAGIKPELLLLPQAEATMPEGVSCSGDGWLFCAGGRSAGIGGTDGALLWTGKNQAVLRAAGGRTLLACPEMTEIVLAENGSTRILQWHWDTSTGIKEIT